MNTDYDTALEWLFATQLHGMKFGLENIRHLLLALGEPQRNLKFIHVAGTNGKGSVCALLDSLARSANIRSGLFTSPHLIRFNERIQFEGRLISDDSVVSGLRRIREQIQEDFHPTFFEITTALALDYFRTRHADLVILETGLGGRLDATNIVTPLVSVLTSIDLDHQRWLGHTIEEIAFEKAGIIKTGIPVVSAPQSRPVRSVIDRTAEERSAPLYYIGEPVEELPVALIGSHQRINAALACASLARAGFPLTHNQRNHGLASVSWPGRFQRFGTRIVLDGAHNPAAVHCLVDTWMECIGQERPMILFGGLGDKDLRTMLATLGRIAARFYFVPVQSRRAATAEEIKSMAPPHLPCSTHPSAGEALNRAQESEGMILVTGSLFLIGEVLAILQPVPGGQHRSSQ